MQVSCKKLNPAQLLRSAGLRRTQARESVLAALLSAGYPMTHQELALTSGLRALDKVTLYRTLTKLRSSRLVHVVCGADKAARFCANRQESGCPGGHAHFQCLKCGRMSCVHKQPVPRITLGKDVVVKTKQLVAFGLCARCARIKTQQGTNLKRPRV